MANGNGGAAKLAPWLSANAETLVNAAAAMLAPHETLKAQAVESVADFYSVLIHAADARDASFLYPLLIDWVETRSVPTDDDWSIMLPVLMQLKQATQQQIVAQCPPDEALGLLLELDALLTDTTAKLASLEMEAALRDVRSKLHGAESKLERLDKSKSDFIAIAAHELKTPLTVIEGYSGILRGFAADSEVHLVLDGLDVGTHRLREIVEDIIDIALIDLNLLGLRFQPIWLHHIIDAVEQRTRPVVQLRHLSIVVERESIPTAATFGDPERLLQAVEKVIMNALKYTPDGGEIVISARELPGFVDLMVQDQGIGIASNELSRIFDAFAASGDVSLHSSGKTKYKGAGAGLGLPIAKGIIEAHGGTIWAESAGYNEAEHPGSIFHIMIPMRLEPPPEPPDGTLDMYGASEV